MLALEKLKVTQFCRRDTIYQITTPGHGYRLRHSKVLICTHLDSSQEVLSNRKPLAFKILPTNQPQMADTNELNLIMNQLIEHHSEAQNV